MRSNSSSTSCRGGRSPRMSSTCSASSPRVKPRSSTRRTPRTRVSSAANGRSGWSRCSSSARKVATSCSGAPRAARTRKARKSRVERSAQWRSSSTKTTGRSSVSRSSSASSSAKRRPWPAPWVGVAPPSPLPSWPLSSSGHSGASSRRSLTLSASSAAPSRSAGRSAVTIAAYGSSPSASSTHSPISTCLPAAAARRSSSPTSRLLPTPASPTTSTAPPSASSAASSAARPTKRSLATRSGIARLSLRWSGAANVQDRGGRAGGRGSRLRRHDAA